jgi:CheY-like chemotaxis protein
MDGDILPRAACGDMDHLAAVRRVAHDYGNILTGILGFSELALAQSPPDSPIRAYLSEIHRSALAGQRLTNTLRLCTRRQWPQEQPARLAPLVEEEAGRLASRWPGLRLDVAVSADLAAVTVEAEPLQHLLAHLLDNAAEAVVNGGSVRVTARTVTLAADQCAELPASVLPGLHIELTVEDSGCGLSPDVQRGLRTVPFFTTKTRHRGYGLAVVHGILAAHRGALRMEPVPAGGTIARAYLPAASATIDETASPEAVRVLVVDDDPLVLHLVRTTLQRAGYHVETATNARDALRSFTEAAEPFRLVLSDLVMPHVSGPDLVRQLQTHDAGVNVLFMSGQMVSGPAAAPMPGTPFELLAKPFRPEGLLRAVRSALERSPRGVPASDGTGDEGVHAPTR